MKLWRNGFYRSRDGSLFLFLSADYDRAIVRLMWLDARSHKDVAHDEVADAVWVSPPSKRPMPRLEDS